MGTSDTEHLFKDERDIIRWCAAQKEWRDTWTPDEKEVKFFEWRADM